MRGSQIAGLLIALTFAATLLTPLNTTVADNSGTVSVTNESVTANADTYVDLNGFNLVSGSDTVYWYNSSSGSYETLSSGSDYKLNESAGTIDILSSGTASDGDKIKVTYDYEATSGTTSTVVTLVPLFAALLLLVVMATKLQSMM